MLLARRRKNNDEIDRSARQAASHAWVEQRFKRCDKKATIRRALASAVRSGEPKHADGRALAMQFAQQFPQHVKPNSP
jgi:hypothetical protein